MPILNIGGDCCICPVPLGSQSCEDFQTGIAEAYYTCTKNLEAIAFAADSESCSEEAEITAFGLVNFPTANALLQPINFVKKDDDSGAVWSFEDKSEDGNTVLEHTFVFQVVANTPAEQQAIRSMLGREIAIVIRTKSGNWYLINWSGGMKGTSNTGNTNQSWKEVTIFGRVNDLPLLISYTDAGAWADANLIPNSVDPLNGLINA